MSSPPYAATGPARFQCYGAGDRVFWRLVGRNHRPLGRSSLVLLNLADTLDAIDLVIARARTATYELASESGRSWSWSMLVDGLVIARSEAGYGRRIECLAGVARFEAQAPRAVVSQDLLPVRGIRSARFRGPTPVARSPLGPLAVHLGLRG